MQNTKKEVAARWGVHPLEINSIMTNYPNDFKDVANDHEKGDLFTDEQMERFGCFIKNETGTSWRSKLMKLLGASCLVFMLSSCGNHYPEVEDFWSTHIKENYNVTDVNVKVLHYPKSRIEAYSDKYHVMRDAVLTYYNGRWYTGNSMAATIFKPEKTREITFDRMKEPLKTDYVQLEEWAFGRISEAPVMNIINRDGRN